MLYTLVSTLVLTLTVGMWLFPPSILPILILSTPLQRYNIFLSHIGLSVKLIIILIPIVYLILFLRERSNLYKDKAFVIFSLLLIAGVSFSLLGSINAFRTISVVGFTVLIVSFSYIVSALVSKFRDLSISIFWFVIAGSMVSLGGIYQFLSFSLGGSPEMPFVEQFASKTISAESFVYSIEDNVLLRPSSTFVDVNITAGFLAITTLLSLALWISNLSSDNTKKSVLFLLSLIMNFTAFSMTISRSGYLGFAIASTFFALFNWRTLLKKEVVTLVVCSALAIVGAIAVFDTPFEAMYGRIKTTFLESDTTGSTQEHMRFTGAAMDIFRDHPIQGIGAGNFEQYYIEVIDPDEDTAYTYNVYAGFLAETGLVGFFSQIAFMVFVFYRGYRSMKSYALGSRERLLTSALVCGYLAVLIANIFYAYYILFFVWLLIGLILSSSNISKTAIVYEKGKEG